MAIPANRERVEKLRSGDGDDPAAAVRAVVQAMLKGTPAERTKAAELYLRYPDAFNELPGDDVRDQLPPGTFIVYPAEGFDDDPVPPPEPPEDEPPLTPSPGHPGVERADES
jgi:hypothetical protein